MSMPEPSGKKGRSLLGTALELSYATMKGAALSYSRRLLRWPFRNNLKNLVSVLPNSSTSNARFMPSPGNGPTVSIFITMGFIHTTGQDVFFIYSTKNACNSKISSERTPILAHLVLDGLMYAIP